ncbi:DNA polymerase III subunit gamma/tau [Lignipirellula cremea]|uniref:DNA polymerase III subunit gamma/tau n=1 Tax=Lignipirellula cremea TaxID=2528010 RepID=A0A518E3F9_9BACT|nr:DNA polymerase III subunit gamma/tau [Lignipirellula cremea]QDU98630.1 DNA polymerase III subunit tau [Lignipirellula cremea]
MADPSAPNESPAGEYIVVARRYRPRDFQELVGQSQVSQALGNAITTNRVGHAYLFTGARGVGKTSTARILAKALNCERGPSPSPCNQCDTCQAIGAGEDVDVLEIDGASNRGIDEIRQLRSNVNVRPSRSRYKVYIIDEVHMLTNPAFNALLKTLEEPPEHVKFIFCTTDPEKIPITVLSRCQRFDFAPVETSEIVERLRFIVETEGLEADPEALQMLARRAGGSMRDSQSLLEQLLSFSQDKVTAESVHRMLGTAHSGRLSSVARHLIDRDAAGALREIEQAVAEGVDVGQLAEQLLGYFRDMAAVTVGCEAQYLLHTPTSEYEALKTAGAAFGLETLLAVMQILDQTLVRLRQSMHTRTLVEMALVRICRLEDLEDLAVLAAAVQGNDAGSRRGPAPRNQTSPALPSPAPRGNPPPAASPPVPPAGKNPPSAQKKTAEITPAEVETAQLVVSQPEKPDSAAADPPAELWRKALVRLEDTGDTTATMAALASQCAISGPNRLVVTFPDAYTKEALERPEKKRAIDEAVACVAGASYQVEFAVLPAAPAEVVPVVPTGVAKRMKQREIEQHPLVVEAIELFAGEIIDIKAVRPS